MPPDKEHYNTRRINAKKLAYYLFVFRRLWVKEPGHSETIFAKKRYTSINVAYVFFL